MSVRFRHIQLLSVELQNQIAAGEVVERPASAVKELVENSLDAGAGQIDVCLERGGRDLIRVRDDGQGIPQDELELSVTRHATSKIMTLEDLEGVMTHGFRGEALPSIVSVSRFHIASAFNGQGAELEVTFGKTGEIAPASIHKGTLVEVRDLFANTPARLKFLKSPATETKRVQDMLFRLALAHTETGFSLRVGERVLVQHLPGESLQMRINREWPEQAVLALRPFDYEAGGLRMHGLAALPEQSQQRSHHILLYVNGRAIQDRRLLAAVREAYKGRLTSRDYPQCILFVEIDPHEVDVNVHPAKTEVRFLNEAQIFSHAVHAVRSAFQETVRLEESHESTKVEAGPGVQNSLIAQRQVPRYDGFWGSIDRTDVFPSRKIRPDEAEEFMKCELPLELQEEDPRQKGLARPWPHLSERPKVQEAMKQENVEAFADQKSAPMDCGLLYLGQIADTYLLFRNARKELMVLDQHAAHERVLYSQLVQGAFAGRSQSLLVPQEMSLHPTEKERLLELLATLSSLGFRLAHSGSVLTLNAIPPGLDTGSAMSFLRDALGGVVSDTTELFKTMACRGAIKAGLAMSPSEVNVLLRQWLACPEREFCPHGRPVVLVWDGSFFERAFKRT